MSVRSHNAVARRYDLKLRKKIARQYKDEITSPFACSSEFLKRNVFDSVGSKRSPFGSALQFASTMTVYRNPHAIGGERQQHNFILRLLPPPLEPRGRQTILHLRDTITHYLGNHDSTIPSQSIHNMAPTTSSDWSTTSRETLSIT
jgi:hypothetical protein